ncbi:RagB/SusD family nutrient uptake outer membrane protein [Chitinophaga oryziterrae]|nr:RagB/SusD family nutrient uptake outer membrane protein [Chitinophaga oryziterrae]
MKASIYIALIFTFTSCQKYVDIKKTSTESLIETASDCQLVLDNYDLFNGNYPYDGEYSADGYYISSDTYNDTYTSIEDKSFYAWEPGAIRAGSTEWVASYKKIYHTNLVLEALAKLDQTSITGNLRGAALFLRAYAYWNLAQLYTKPYGTTSNQDPGLPLHLKSDVNDVPGRGTVQQTYDRIITDLKEAGTLLNETAPIGSRPVKAAAYAMLARVYLSMEDYANALTSANTALSLKSTLMDFNTLDTESGTPFARYNEEVIFHSILGNNALLSAGNPFSNVAKINTDFISAYDDNDLRKTIFFKPNEDINEGTFRFTGNYEPGTSATLFTGLTVDELYLVRAECNARAGNAATAMTDLNTLLRSRWVSGTYTDMTAANADEALSKVLTERRKELIMRGQRWTDLRRLNKDVRFKTDLSRSVVVDGATQTFTLPANDSRYTLLIPQEVITNSSLPQNAR